MLRFSHRRKPSKGRSTIKNCGGEWWTCWRYRPSRKGDHPRWGCETDCGELGFIQKPLRSKYAQEESNL